LNISGWLTGCFDRTEPATATEKEFLIYNNFQLHQCMKLAIFIVSLSLTHTHTHYIEFYDIFCNVKKVNASKVRDKVIKIYFLIVNEN
jgi:hypothetical protein